MKFKRRCSWRWRRRLYRINESFVLGRQNSLSGWIRGINFNLLDTTILTRHRAHLRGKISLRAVLGSFVFRLFSDFFFLSFFFFFSSFPSKRYKNIRDAVKLFEIKSFPRLRCFLRTRELLPGSCCNDEINDPWNQCNVPMEISLKY